MSKVNWKMDPTHSEIGFKVKHMMMTNVSGSFKEFNAEAESDGEDFSNTQISFTAKAASVNTGNEQRDGHLCSPEFFDVEKFPAITFKSTKFVKADGDDFKLEGDLTLKDVTKNIQLNVEFGGLGKDPWGNLKAGFTISGKINRKDFGLGWNAALEAGGVLVSEEVRINGEIQMVKA